MFSSLIEKIFKPNKKETDSIEKVKVNEVEENKSTELSKTSSKKVSIILESAKYNKALVARDIRELTGVSFKESYNILEKQNARIKEDLDIEEAESIKHKLENLNAKVVLK